eukprot:COSAG01_NODE_11621_length_1892_cov_4.730212_2_plen_78_part_00
MRQQRALWGHNGMSDNSPALPAQWRTADGELPGWGSERVPAGWPPPNVARDTLQGPVISSCLPSLPTRGAAAASAHP